ncbi:proline-rich receptor-like protein kinase PERK14 [Vigna angularis]|uniref:proline-rich receptor-like protein kinase PERK14 n=1 Tax=Phaseolus angularis TaxID=3914 RepID=UPI000809AA8A|nr:proline-rich receptor-like protein kinase PERK14 [Vigna angularis]
MPRLKGIGSSGTEIVDVVQHFIPRAGLLTGAKAKAFFRCHSALTYLRQISTSTTSPSSASPSSCSPFFLCVTGSSTTSTARRTTMCSQCSPLSLLPLPPTLLPLSGIGFHPPLQIATSASRVPPPLPRLAVPPLCCQCSPPSLLPLPPTLLPLPEIGFHPPLQIAKPKSQSPKPREFVSSASATIGVSPPTVSGSPPPRPPSRVSPPTASGSPPPPVPSRSGARETTFSPDGLRETSLLLMMSFVDVVYCAMKVG